MFSRIARRYRKLRSELDFLRGALEPAVGPRFAQVEPTVRCNLRCRMCPRTLEPAAFEGPDLGRDEFRRILDQLPALEKLQLSGFGEPFLHPELPEMIADAAERGIAVSVNTNSTVLTAELAERVVASGVERIKLSLDSAVPDEFLRIRGVPLERVCEKIKLLVEAKRRSGGEKPILSLNVVVQVENVLHLDRFFPLAEQLGVDALRFKAVLGFRAAQLEGLKVGGAAAEPAVGEALARAKAAAENSAVPNNFARFVRKIAPATRQSTPSGGQRDKSEKAPFPRCLYPWLATFISSRGVVRACCKFYRDGMLDLGNVLAEPMAAIWHSSAYRRVRRAFLEGRPAHPVCLDCDQLGRSRAAMERARRRYRWLGPVAASRRR